MNVTAYSFKFTVVNCDVTVRFTNRFCMRRVRPYKPSEHRARPAPRPSPFNTFASEFFA